MYILALFLFILDSSLLASSAHRPAGKDYRELARAQQPSFLSDDTPTPYRSRSFWKKELLAGVNDYTELLTAHESFKEVRDLRAIAHQDKMRRSSWMYPDDGCYVRAEYMLKYFQEKLGQRLQKIFVFGNLQVDTEFHASRRVAWWYHVAPILRIGEEVFVFDPSVEARAPLEVEAWLEKISQDKDLLEVTICPGLAVTPFGDCFSQIDTSDKDDIDSQPKFLDAEERRLRSLDFDVEAYLGDHPPWFVGE